MLPFDSRNLIYTSNLFTALQSVASLLDRPLSIGANQPPLVAQALRQSGCDFTLCDVDYYGIPVPCGDTFIATDYAGIMPEGAHTVSVWFSSTAWLDTPHTSPITIIDLRTLNPFAKTSGAIILCDDDTLRDSLARYLSYGVKKGVVWNDAVEGKGIDGLMQPLAREYWERTFDTCAEQARHAEKIAALYDEKFETLKPVDLIPHDRPSFYPLKLAPELFCPKEDIYTALLNAEIDVIVPYKPLFRYKAFEGETLRGCMEFYRAVLALPVQGITEQQGTAIAEAFTEIIKQYAYRGCSF